MKIFESFKGGFMNVIAKASLGAAMYLGWIRILTVVIFWLLWTVCGLGKIYGYFIPEVFQSIGFWDCIGLFIIFNTFKMWIFSNVN